MKPKIEDSRAFPRTTRPPAPDDPRRELTWIGVSFSDFERLTIEEIFRRGGFARLDDVILAGLWHLVRQYDLDAPITAFTRARSIPVVKETKARKTK